MLNTFNKNTFKDVEEFGNGNSEVMKKMELAEDFDYRGFALDSIIYTLEKRIDELKQLRFEHNHIRPMVEEITRPFGE
jgi:hypothetical protein